MTQREQHLYLATVELAHTHYMSSRGRELETVNRLVMASDEESARAKVVSRLEWEDPYGHTITVNSVEISEVIE